MEGLRRIVRGYYEALLRGLRRLPALSVLIPITLGIVLMPYNISHSWALPALACGLCLVALSLILKDTPQHIKRNQRLLRLGLFCSLCAMTSLRATYSDKTHPPCINTGLSLRQKLANKLQACDISPEHQQTISALSLGLLPKSQEGQSLRKQFARSGAAHLLVVSGYHLALVVYILSLAFAFVRHRHIKLYYLLLITSAWAFAILTELSPATERAALMLTLFLLARLLGRQTYFPNILIASACIQLILTPSELSSWSMWLSYTAVLSIYLYFDIIKASVGTLRQPTLASLWSILSLSLSAQILTLPLALYLFGEISWSFVITTIPLTLLASLIIPLGLLTMLCAYLGLSLPFIEILLNKLTGYMLGITDLASQWELLITPYPLPLWALLGLWAIALTLRLSKRRRNPSNRIL